MVTSDPKLIRAIKAHAPAIVRLLLEKEPATMNEKDIFGRTALMWAAMEKHEEILKALIDADVKVHEKCDEGKTALMGSALTGWAKGAEILVRTGIDPNEKDDKGRTALIWATFGKHMDVIKVLLEAGAKPDETDRFDRSALSIARERHYDDLVSIYETFPEEMEKQKQRREREALEETFRKEAARHQEILKQKKPANPLKRKPL